MSAFHVPENARPWRVSALANWRFRPVLRGSEAIDAQAILGLGVDTR